MGDFRLHPALDMSGSCYLAELDLPPARLVARFGPPPRGDGYKVSGYYTFQDAEGSAFSLYDWKCTTLYEDEERVEPRFPTPEAFWSDTSPRRLNIGGREGEGDVETFKEWLLDQLLPTIGP